MNNAKVRPAAKRAAATTRSTAGPGFDFEDRVSAWFQLGMLSGEPVPAVGGDGHLVSAQTGALGWQIDDLLIAARSIDGEARLAISAKSSVQVTAVRLPADFVSRAWEQWRNPSPMDRARDTLALATRGQNNEFTEVWTDIRDWCASSDPALPLARIAASAKHTRVFESVRNPKGMTVAATAEEAVALIRHLEVMPFDFQHAASRDELAAVARCRLLLVDGDLEKARNLWRELVQIGAEVRMGRGSITLSEIIARVRSFGLRDHADFRSSWDALTALSEDRRQRVQTALSTGYTLPRPDLSERLAAQIRAQPITPVYGESGSGKSALVKSVLDNAFPKWRQVWLGPEELQAALSAQHRAGLRLRHPLADILKATSSGENVLVLDAAERLNADVLKSVSDLFREIVPAGQVSAWRVVVVTQTQSWSDRHQILLGQRTMPVLEVPKLEQAEIRAALWKTPGLSWITAHSEIVDVLANPQTLAWVVDAAADFGTDGAALSSHIKIVDRLWERWTGGRTDVHNLLVRLAEREADFERSFSRSSLSSDDAAVFDSGLERLPLRLNHRNRIEFEHDLAADWARYQLLRESADDPSRWAPLASNPLWTPALRLLAQFLLREPSGEETAWDAALLSVEGGENSLAADMLLDGLCLDPDAEKLLTQRADLLFADRGRRLNRLLNRFHHIATVPSAAYGLLNLDPSLSLHIEDRFRTPIVGRWPPIARFLAAHRDRVASLASTAVSRLCETWLTNLPTELDGGTPMPYRKEFAELALATAREVQFDLAKGHGYLGDAQDIFYSATLAGAPDLPDDIVAWALEMSGRRPQSERITERVAEARAAERAARAERLKTDEKYRANEAARMKRLRNLPHSIPMSRALPAWPLGPQHEVDHHARKVFIETNALVSLMKVRPKESAEILLGMLIEDNPKEEFGSGRIDIDLGLAYENQSYPTVFFKSPFFAFLTTAPEEALGALIQLVNFCTERWIASVGRDRRIDIPGVSLTLADGSTKLFQGNRRIFGWAHFRSSKDGQLYSALNALERWLTFELEQGRAIATHVERVLREGTSVAFLGVLADVAKFRPALLGAELAPLLRPETLHWWDRDRQQERMDSFGWPSSGGLVDELAKEWSDRAYRQQTFTEMLAHQVPRDAVIAALVKDAVSEWQAPQGDAQEALHFRVLCAELDRDNYSPVADPSTGETTFQMRYPDELQQAVLEHNHAVASEPQPLLLSYRCKQVIEQGSKLPGDQAALLYAAWRAAEADASLSADDKSKVAVAASAALMVCAPDWLAAKSDERTAAESTIRQLCSDEGVASSADEMRSARIHSVSEDLTLGAHAVARQWIADPASGAWDKEVLVILTSGDVRGVGVLLWLAHADREKLGARWWRLLEIGLLWSALAMLGPDHGDPPELAARWELWLKRLRSFKLTGASSAEASINVLAVAKGFARLKRGQWRRAYERESDPYFRRDPSNRHMPGLDTHFLGGLFGWLLDTRQSVSGPALKEQHRLIKQLWDYETAYLDDHRNDKGECQLPYQFGYDVASKLAQLSLILPAAKASEAWEAALRLGPDAHAVADHFAQAFWLQVQRGTDDATFARVWRGVVTFALDQPWYSGGRWYYGERTLRRLLGFGHGDSGAAAKAIGASLPQMRDLFERWAKEHLRTEEENVGGLAHFLTTAGGTSLRIEGMGWIATAIKASPEGGRWYRENTNESLVGLLDAALANDARVLTTNEDAREALMVIAADLTKRNVTAALSLQERIRQLR